MATQQQVGWERKLKALEVELAAWRSEQEGGSRRIPETLWRGASQIAAVAGVGKVAVALKLDHTTLKKRVAALETEKKQSTVADSPASFVELSYQQDELEVGSCLLEITSPGGARMRLQLAKLKMADVLCLVQEFRN